MSTSLHMQSSYLLVIVSFDAVLVASDLSVEDTKSCSSGSVLCECTWAEARSQISEFQKQIYCLSRSLLGNK
jgi:hypothetical protein